MSEVNEDDFQPNYSLLDRFDPSTLTDEFATDAQAFGDLAQLQAFDGPSTSSPSSHLDQLQVEDGKADEHTKQQILSLMAVNKIYLDFVNRLVIRVDRAIDHNRELQAAVKAQLASRKRCDEATRSVAAQLACFPPYFKDFSGMAPRSNEDAEKISQICYVDPLIAEERNWRVSDVQMLRRAVKNSILDNMIMPLANRKEILVEKLRSAGIDVGIEQRQIWLDEMDHINRRILYLRDRSDAEVFQKSNYENIDWMKISSTDFNGGRSVTQLRMKWLNDEAPHINKSAWTSAEIHKLRELSSRPWMNWDFIADELGTHRGAYQCFARFRQLSLVDKSRRQWTAEEDEKVQSLVQTLRVGNEIPWHKIATYIPGRSKESCESRYERSLNRRIKHGRWTITEDLILLNSINKYGPQDWPRIAHTVQNRTAIQCRDRWINVLDYKRRNRPWLWEEHERLFFGIRTFGRKNCAKIALLLPGRNNMDVKIRIRALVRYKIAKYEEQVSGMRKAEYKNFASDYLFKKDRRDMVLSKFRQFSSVLSQFDKSSQQIDLRMGIGAFMLSPDGNPVDYTLSKKILHTEFGKFVSTSGRWSGIARNPNEFGSDELEDELRKLPAEKQKELRAFLKESDIRYALERRLEEQCPEETADDLIKFYELLMSDERMQRLNDLIDEHLSIEASDIIRYNKAKTRPPKMTDVREQLAKSRTLPSSSPATSQGVVKAQRRRKRKVAGPSLNMSTMIAPKRAVTVSDRLLEEVKRSVASVDELDRRACVLRNLCTYIRRSDEMENIQHYTRSGLKSRALKSILEYLSEMLNTSGSNREQADAVIPFPTDEACTSRAEISDSSVLGHGDIMKIHAMEFMPREVSPSSIFTAPLPDADMGRGVAWWNLLNRPESSAEFSLRDVLSSLLPPCMATLNATLLSNKTRCELTKNAARLFDAVDAENLSHRKPKTMDESLDIRLSRKIVDSDEYVKLKKRMYQMLFLPTLMQMALTKPAELEKRRAQREVITQRRVAEIEFANEFCERLRTSDGELDAYRSRIFRTYDNTGTTSLENNFFADSQSNIAAQYRKSNRNFNS